MENKIRDAIERVAKFDFGHDYIGSDVVDRAVEIFETGLKDGQFDEEIYDIISDAYSQVEDEMKCEYDQD